MKDTSRSLATYPLLLLLGSMILGCGERPIKAASDKDTPEQSLLSPLPIVHQEIHGIDTSIAYLMGRFEPAERSEFRVVDTSHADRAGLYLRKDTYSAFTAMSEAAAKDGVKFVIRSATRNFQYQKGIWERKWSGQTKLEGNIDATTMADYRDRALAILRYSSMPGSSRHHWGTDIDLNSFDNAYFGKGQGKVEYDWLIANAHSYGFCQPYTAKGPERPNGYQEEKWHWSFYPVSNTLTQAARRHLKDDMLQDFHGSESAPHISIVQNFVLGINQECL